MTYYPSYMAEKKMPSTQELLLSLWASVNEPEGLSYAMEQLGQSLGVEFLCLYQWQATARAFNSVCFWGNTEKFLSEAARHINAKDTEIVELHSWASKHALAPSDNPNSLPRLFKRYLEKSPPKISLILSPLIHHANDKGGGTGREGKTTELLGLLEVGLKTSAKDQDGPKLHHQLLKDLQAPFIAALTKQRQISEINKLRSAAEEDSQSLLNRLGKSTANEPIIGANSGLKRVMQRVDQVSKTEAGVLLLGETGSGKEVVARAIHLRSKRHNNPFIRVNCGALPSELIDSELFGHEKGSFTGAHASRRGWFERADGGTLFLDEVGELSSPAQVRLLRVLQDGIIQKVGSERDIQVNVRLIAATHRDLPKMVQEGSFREDLWYRLAVFPIILPALHERPEDIEDLANHFVQRAAMKMGISTPPISAMDVQHLQSYPWPGNVRELGSVLERAVILGHGQYLDLDTALGTQAPASRKIQDKDLSGDEEISNTSMTLDEAISAHIIKTLRSTHGRVDGPHGAAQRLDLNVSTLRAKLRKLGIEPQRYK
jgi:transcriptional regulator with GAF, ATPase, and Fis domain